MSNIVSGKAERSDCKYFVPSRELGVNLHLNRTTSVQSPSLNLSNQGISMATNDEEFARGQKDYVRTKDDLGGSSKSTPWANPFESRETNLEKDKAYNDGFDNAAKNDKRR